jgi:hypothetical protein
MAIKNRALLRSSKIFGNRPEILLHSSITLKNKDRTALFKRKLDSASFQVVVLLFFKQLQISFAFSYFSLWIFMEKP